MHGLIWSFWAYTRTRARPSSLARVRQVSGLSGSRGTGSHPTYSTMGKYDPRPGCTRAHVGVRTVRFPHACMAGGLADIWFYEVLAVPACLVRNGPNIKFPKVSYARRRVGGSVGWLIWGGDADVGTCPAPATIVAYMNPKNLHLAPPHRLRRKAGLGRWSWSWGQFFGSTYAGVLTFIAVRGGRRRGGSWRCSFHLFCRSAWRRGEMP